MALYLLKYLNEWITLEELEHPLVAGSAARSRVQELLNIGWPISYRETTCNPVQYKLLSDPRKTLAEAAK